MPAKVTRFAAGLVALALFAPLLTSQTADATIGTIQPGDVMTSSSGQCTLNFVFDGAGVANAGKVYMGTAAHCVEELGQKISSSPYANFGKVAWIGNANSVAMDFAFIEVYNTHVHLVKSFVKGHPTIPVGHTVPADTTIGDLVQISGYGAGYGTTGATQERRIATMGADTATTHNVAGPIHWGDSGGPLVHIPTGKALGIVSQLCIGACTETGPSVQGMINQAAATGFLVTLRDA